jgi:hypothetical protein
MNQQLEPSQMKLVRCGLSIIRTRAIEMTLIAILACVLGATSNDVWVGRVSAFLFGLAALHTLILWAGFGVIVVALRRCTLTVDHLTRM